MADQTSDATRTVSIAMTRRRKSHASRTALVMSAAIHGLLFVSGFYLVVSDAVRPTDTDAFSADMIEVGAEKRAMRRRPLRVKPIASTRATTPIPVLRDMPSTTADVPSLPGDTPLSLSAPAPSVVRVDARATPVRLPVAAARTLATPERPRLVAPPASTPRPKLDGLLANAHTQVFHREAPNITFHGGFDVEQIRLPRFRHRIVPRYPEAARRAQIQGVVILEARVDTDGSASDVQVVQGLGHGCDEAAVAALRASSFTPALRGEQPAAARIRIPYRFRMGEL